MTARHATRAIAASLVLAVASACGGATASEERARPDEPRSAGSERGVGAEGPDGAGEGEVVVGAGGANASRVLPRGASFADLAAAARRQDDLRDQDSTAGCVLSRRDDGGLDLTADLAVAVRPLPVPESDLDGRMAGTAPVRVLTRYGSYGEAAAPPIALSAMTTTAPPDRPVALVVFLTDRGAYARRTDVAFGEVRPRPLDELVGLLPYAEVATTFVTAEAGVPLETLAELLRALPSTLAGNVGLAVALEAGTRLPDEPAALDDDVAPVCAGLSDPPPDAREGTLEAADIVAALGPLRTAAAVCVGATPGPGARGGRLSLAVRIGEEGRVLDACIRSDSSDDPHLRACVVRAARALVFPAAGGLVDFELPLSLSPGAAHHQRPLCE